MPTPTEYAITDREGLLFLVRQADQRDLNRRGDLDLLAVVLDPKGVNLFHLVLADHQADPARNLPTHHRYHVSAKITDQREPEEFFLDVADEDHVALLPHVVSVDQDT